MPVVPLNLRLGTDLVFMPRYQKHLDNPIFLKRILTENEQAIYNKLKLDSRKLEFICGRYAAKEAYTKAMGKGIGVLDFLDFEVLMDESGKPISNPNTEISISHDGDYTIAVVIVCGEV